MGSWASFSHAQEHSDDTAAILITEASLTKFGKGNVVGYFPKALISRDPTRRKKGYFIFDDSAESFEKTQIPLQITFEWGTKTLEQSSKDWKLGTPETFTYALATDVFLAKLRLLLAENSKVLAPDFLPTEPFTGLKSIAKETPVSRYLLKKGSETSYRMEIGDRTLLDEKHKSISLPEVVNQMALYQQHFKTVNLQLQIFKLRPGERPNNPRLVQGVALVRHHHPAMPEGRVVINYGATRPPWSMATNRLEFAGESVDFEFPASTFIENVVAPLLVENGKIPLKFECVIGDFEEETACKKSKDGSITVKGNLAPGGSLAFIIERAANANESIDAYRDLYRVDIHTAK